MKEAFVAILMGSDSDLPTMQSTLDILDHLEVPYEVKITSAHRTPDATHHYVSSADKRGCAVFIGAAGLAAHLAGALAGRTTLPVIGVPIAANSGVGGLDALLSTVQMPPGVPVATVAIGKAGAVNAALFAGQILGAKYPEIRDAVRADREARRVQALATPDPRDAE